jgi:hypothetical protein
MKKIFYLITLFASVMQAQVGIGTTAPKGALDINADLPAPSTDQAGFVPPIVGLTATNSFTTTTSTIINPNGGAVVTGTIVYNTATSAAGPNQVTPGYYFYNGTVWEKLGSGAAAGTDWSINGNSGTNETTNFIGTTDDAQLVFKAENVERLRINNITDVISTTTASIGVGTTAPSAKIEIDNSGTLPQLELESRATAPTGTANGQMAIIDGSLFIYDTARGKWLSSETMTYAYGNSANTNNTFLDFANLNSQANSGAKILKNATIVGITAMGSGGNATKGFNIVERSGATTISTNSFNLIGLNYSNYSSTINYDITEGNYITIFVQNDTNIANPTVILHLKWRQ